MKKLLVLFFILNIAVGFAIAADAKTYTFGSVKISQVNELPSGYFTKAKNYLPGDSIAISNPQNGTEVNVLNLGTLDDSGDVAILISPEVASKLGLDFSVQLRIKLAPRPDDFDEIASGSGVLSYGASVYADEEDAVETVSEMSFNRNETVSLPSENDISTVVEEAVLDSDLTEIGSDETDVVAEEISTEEKIEPVADLSALYESAVEESVFETEELAVNEDSVSVADDSPAIASEIEPAVEEENVLESAVADVASPEQDSVPERKEQNLEPLYESFVPVTEEFTDYFLTETDPITPEKTIETPVPAEDAPLEKIVSDPIAVVEEEFIEEDFISDKEEKLPSVVMEKISDEPIASAEPFDFADSIETNAIKDEPEVTVLAAAENTDEPEETEVEYEEEVYVPEIEEIVETTSVFSLTPTTAVVPEYDPKYARQQPQSKKEAPKKVVSPSSEEKPKVSSKPSTPVKEQVQKKEHK